MRSNNGKNSYFISFEGIEGSGKTTQIKELTSYLESKNFRVTSLREPGGTKFGEKLREAILQSDEQLHPLSEALLFASSRAQLLNQTILPMLKEDNTVIILDRYIDSSIAYQGFARELGMDTILDIHSHSPLNNLPDLTLYLKIDLHTSMQRQDARGNEKDYFEKQDKSFYESLIQGYDSCLERFPKRVKLIDAKQSQQKVTASIIKTVDTYLNG